jgi:hypothetical protein
MSQLELLHSPPCLEEMCQHLWRWSLEPGAAADMYEYTINLRRMIAEAHAYVRKNMLSALDCQRKAYYKDRKSFWPTQPAWLWTQQHRPGQSRKFALYWIGAWQIKKQLNKLMYKIRPLHSWARQGSDYLPQTIPCHRRQRPGVSLLPCSQG